MSPLWATMIAIAAIQNSGSNHNVPDALSRAWKTRHAWCTGEVEWMATSIESGRELSFTYTSRFAGSDHMIIKRGDQDGGVLGDGDGNTAVGERFAFSEQRILIKDGEQFHYVEEAVTARVCDANDDRRKQPFKDVRSFGFWADPYYYNEGFEEIPFDRLGTVTVDDNGSAVLVKAVPREGIVLTWELSPEFGGQPVRTAMFRDGVLMRECVTMYDLYDGHYFPRRVEYRDSGTLVKSYDILAASFDEPSLPQELTPDMLDIPVGSTLNVRGRGMVWDGVRPVSIAEAIERRKSGELDYSRFEELLADPMRGRYPKSSSEGDFDLQEVRSHPLLWEEFVRRFIRVFALSPDQVERAWSIHKTCQRKALEHLDSRRDDLARVVEAQRSFADRTDRKSAQDSIDLKEREARLTQPVCDLFDDRLKPELVKFLRPEQKDRALQRERERPGSSGIAELLKSADHDRAIREAISGKAPQ